MRTESLCPICLKKIPARYERSAETIQLVKTCSEHGEFSVPAWKIHEDGPDFLTWRAGIRKPAFPVRPATGKEKGCPFDCGLCPEHEQHTCVGLVEVTQRCSLGCPVCYAGSGRGDPDRDPSLEDLERRMDVLAAVSGPCQLQLSGGEPSERDDLPQIIRLAARKGFSLIQVNTNGLRLAGEQGFAQQIKEAGLDSVYLQFDGLSDAAYVMLRGRPLLKEKLAALEACQKAGLGVVLVCTLVRGANEYGVGALTDFAAGQGPTVRGVHFQPAASFGRFPRQMEQAQRITLPELMHLLEAQTSGRIRARHFHPPSCEHPLCSFSAVYARKGSGLSAEPISSPCCCGSAGSSAVIDNAEGSRISRAFTAAHWGSPAKKAGGISDDFDKFIAACGADTRFTVSAMAFQDSLSVDVKRLRTCCIHVAAADGRLIPFCMYNITSLAGVSPYRGADVSACRDARASAT